MSYIETAYDIVTNDDFWKCSDQDRLIKALAFHDALSRLSKVDADLLRSCVDSKDRLSYFSQVSVWFAINFPEAHKEVQERWLCVLLAFYAFDNMGFGYDTLLHIDAVLPHLRTQSYLTRNAWNCHRHLVDELPLRAFESRVF
ncbi:MAG: hypothetical protein HWE34_13990 [Methylocystaceae bacterium]|nr:hypothetical protein [Methylocystaceae bacterium]